MLPHRLRHTANRILRAIPRKCVLCDFPARSSNLCTQCRNSLPSLKDACPLCALPLGVINSAVCGPCLVRPPVWQQAFCVFHYAYPVDRLLHQFKYQANLATGHVLSQLMAAHLSTAITATPDLIVPVPLHWKRHWKRGFNQSGELAAIIGQQLDIPADQRLCKRTRNTAAQAQLNFKQRKANLKGVFQVSKAIRGLRIAMVDDVITTGATASAVTAALLRAGASHVQVWACARVFIPDARTGIQ